MARAVVDNHNPNVSEVFASQHSHPIGPERNPSPNTYMDV